jgi:hypothetical protein
MPYITLDYACKHCHGVLAEEKPAEAMEAVVSRKDQRKIDAENRRKYKPLYDALTKAEDAVAAPPTATTQPEYVYLSRVVPPPWPKAKMPVVPFPAEEPPYAATVAAPPAATTSPEYVYLLRVVEAQGVLPKAKMPTVLLPAAEPSSDASVAAPPVATTQLA